ncbi:hypothetical protein BQ8794_10026 [Mesorhizobium prunaredense]|uniref:Uncharacterized protein n=1 Tax=Mesorhizobium prunaredense TaxID=1631249 RepID=A0A1R3UYE2_9HYPH|nr:hypothetical protein [Mesorhizobium prunaredense]SIT52656.1 hypothetical protein BQ8794_10026 [Mesorhizobium prunaredense]
MSPVNFAGNDKIARCARWLVETPRSQLPPANVYAHALRDHFKLTTAELLLAHKEADRLREEK